MLNVLLVLILAKEVDLNLIVLTSLYGFVEFDVI